MTELKSDAKGLAPLPFEAVEGFEVSGLGVGDDFRRQ
jgi:hypothetical protein